MIYLIGSLRNPKIPFIANTLQDALQEEVFSDWACASENADDAWRDHSKIRGLSYQDALKGYAARHVFEFDKFHITRADAVVLVAPSGKSAHLELGFALGAKKKGYYLLDDPDRWDVMLKFCTAVVSDVDELIREMLNGRTAD